MSNETRDRLLRKPEVLFQTGQSNSAFYRLIADGDFPSPIKIGNRSHWLQSDVDKWISAKVAAARGNENAA